jgi:hypothetical protein
VDKATHYRRRASDVRKIAEGINDPEERSKLIAIADDYDTRALEAEGGAVSLGIVSGSTGKV